MNQGDQSQCSGTGIGWTERWWEFRMGEDTFIPVVDLWEKQ